MSSASLGLAAERAFAQRPGAITGTPSVVGTFSFTAQARDFNGNTGSRAYTVEIGGNTLAISPASLANGSQGTAYSQTVTASGGSGSYTYSVSSGSLPTGLSLNAGSGAITGTPTLSARIVSPSAPSTRPTASISAPAITPS